MTAFPTVQGRCPACRATSLFLGDGGHVTCARIDCPDPSAADDLLHSKAHDGPSVIECTANDRAHWNDKYAGEGP
ncbi:DUF6085 family protein [Streptomyces sp. NPDC056390]|uniref:DUF6085 family protein n=1 Tax=Streptomyces sp. NPDC056390 TaxID=3345806 RepID=UPI0035D530D3